MAASAADLARSKKALETFRGAIMDIVTDLEGSAASKSKIESQDIARASLSAQNATFAEADALFSTYREVHSALANLSQGLSDQIAMLSIAILAADGNYDAIDEETRQRFWAIHAKQQNLWDEAQAKRQSDKRANL